MRNAVGDWLKGCPIWQFVVIWAAALAIGCTAGGILGQLWRHHLDWGELAGMAVGGAAGGSITAAWYRLNQKWS